MRTGFSGVGSPLSTSLPSPGGQNRPYVVSEPTVRASDFADRSIKPKCPDESGIAPRMKSMCVSRRVAVTERGTVHGPGSPRPVRRGGSRTLTVFLVIFIASIMVLSLPTARPTPASSSPTTATNGPAGDLAPAAPAAPAAAVRPAGNSSDVPCYSLNGTICVSITNTSEPNIIPPAGSHVSGVEPTANTTINLWVRSVYPLTWSGNVPTSGHHSPLSLNATGTLWNGVPYYSLSDGTMWNPPGNVWWSLGPTNANKTYPYYYGLTFPAHGSSGVPNFFPGMTLTWWIYFVQNTSGIFTHWSSVNFTFTWGGAWPASPFPSAPQYGGPSAAADDLATTWSPKAPNYDDSVTVDLETTPQDLVSSATIGGAYLDLTESAPDGATINQTTFTFPVNPVGGVGAIESHVVFPASLAFSPGALVTFRITAWDMSEWAAGQTGPDLIVTQTFDYTVNGNGTFASGFFPDDLSLTSVPVGPALGGGTPATVPAGLAVAFNLQSRDSTTAIFAAEILLTFTYPGIGETSQLIVPFHRENSTNFAGSIPGLPLGSNVQFTVLAWDFSKDREVSQVYQYNTPTVASLLPTIPTNSTFFVAYVYDNGSQHWVSGASVEVSGLSGSSYVHITTQSFGGVAYPNQTGALFVPLLLTAGASYRITVNDSSFLPDGARTAPSVGVTVVLPRNPTRTGVLVAGSDYIVAEAGPSIYFWLNQTEPGVTYSAPTTAVGTLTIAAGIGLAGLALAVIPLSYWWSRIRARRRAEERRITL
jgi:hypothetical protein